MGYRVLGEIAMVVHFAFIAYVILGGFLAWRWPWALGPHLAAVGWRVGTVLVTLPCPLTDVEDWARRRADQAGLPRGFVDRYLEGVAYPEPYTAVLQWIIAAVIAAAWFGVYLRRRAQAQAKHDRFAR